MKIKNADLKDIRALILGEQQGFCGMCGEIPRSPVADHDHIKRLKGTGKIRGVLCSNCNVFLGKIENNTARYGIKRSNLPEILRSIADYLEKPQYQWYHPIENKNLELKLMKSSYNDLVKACNKIGRRYPAYPRKGVMTKGLTLLFNKFNLQPKFYGESKLNGLKEKI